MTTGPILRGEDATAVRAQAEAAFARGTPRVELRVDVTDPRAARTALAAGFRFEGVARGGLDGAGDLAVFARLPGDDAVAVPAALPPLPDGGLTDGTITVRVVEPADAPALVEQESDELTVATGFGGAPDPAAITRRAARAGLDWLVGAGGLLAIVDDASGACAGCVRLRFAGPPQIGGIGYTVHPDFRGRGYTARALRLLVPWAFEQADFARLELGAKRDNVASQRAALAGGFAPDGVREQRLRGTDGTFADEIRFVLLNPRYS